MTWWLDSPPVGRSLRPWGASPASPGDRENFTAVQASAASRSILVLHPPRDLPMDWGPCLGQRRFPPAELGSLYYRGTRPRREPGSFQGCCSSAKMVSTTPFLAQGCMPIPKVLGQPTPLTAMLCHLQHGMEYLPVTSGNVTALARQQSLDLLVCFFC